MEMHDKKIVKQNSSLREIFCPLYQWVVDAVKSPSGIRGAIAPRISALHPSPRCLAWDKHFVTVVIYHYHHHSS